MVIWGTETQKSRHRYQITSFLCKYLKSKVYMTVVNTVPVLFKEATSPTMKKKKNSYSLSQKKSKPHPEMSLKKKLSWTCHLQKSRHRLTVIWGTVQWQTQKSRYRITVIWGTDTKKPSQVNGYLGDIVIFKKAVTG